MHNGNRKDEETRQLIKESRESIVDEDVKTIMNWTDEQAWRAITGTAYTSKPSNLQVTKTTMDSRMENIKVTIRTGKNTRKNEIMKVNRVIAPIWEAFFKELYEECQNFYIVSYNGGYVYRNSTKSTKMSAHAFGCAVDINANIKGNRYGEKPYSKFFRNLLVNKAVKYSTIYLDSPMLDIAHKYSIVNGSDWSKPNDAMHFSFIGDWSRKDAMSYIHSNNEIVETQDLKYGEITEVTDKNDLATVYNHIEDYILSCQAKENKKLNNLIDLQYSEKNTVDIAQFDNYEKFIVNNTYSENEKLTITRYYMFGKIKENVDGEERFTNMAFVVRCDFENMTVSIIAVNGGDYKDIDNIKKSLQYVDKSITLNEDNSLNFIRMNEEKTLEN